MGEITKVLMDNGTTEYKISGIDSNGIYDITRNGQAISSNTVSLNYNDIASHDRVNLHIKRATFQKFETATRVKLRFTSTTSDSAGTIFKITKEDNLESNNKNSLITYSESVGLNEYECDITELFNNASNSDIYIAIRPLNGTCIFYTTSSNQKPAVVYSLIVVNQGLLNQKFISGSAGRALNYDVNVRNGQVYFSKKLVSLGGLLMPLDLDLVFNNTYKDTEWFIGMPHGWKTNYHQKIVKQLSEYIYTDSIGIEHRFVKSLNSNTFYFDIAGTGLILKVNNDGTYTIDDGYNNYLDFNTSGYLSSIRKVIGEESVVTTIGYFPLTNRIYRIYDGMSRYVEFEYNEDTIRIFGNMIKDITLDIFNNKLTNILECNGRKSEYSYGNYGLGAVKSDNGEKINIYYDAKNRVIKVEERVEKTENVLISSKSFTYLLTNTIVTDNKGVKFVYSFNEEGEFSGVAECLGHSNGRINLVNKVSFENYASMINKERKFYINSYTVYGPNKITDKETMTKSNIIVKKGNICLLKFTYRINSVQNPTEADFKVRIYQGNIYVLELYLDPSKLSGTIVCPFVCDSDKDFKVEFTHNNLFGNTTYTDLVIYKLEPAETYDCVNKNYNNLTSVTGSRYNWYELPKENSFTYSSANTPCNKTMYFEDIVENQKNCKLNSGSYNVWYNKKRGLIANTTNLSIKLANISYPIMDIQVGKVNIGINRTTLTFNNYKKDTTNLAYQYNYFLNGTLTANIATKVINKNFLPVSYTDYTGVVTTYTYDLYGNLLTEEIKKNNLKYYKKYEYNDYKFLNKVFNYLGSIESTYTFEYDSKTGNLIKTIEPNNNEITYTYDQNTNQLLSISSNNNTNNINYEKDMISKLLSSTSGYNFLYDKYNMISQVKYNEESYLTDYLSYNNQLSFNNYTYDLIDKTLPTGVYNTKIYNKYGIMDTYAVGIEDCEILVNYIYSDIPYGEGTDDEVSNAITQGSKLREITNMAYENIMNFNYNEDGLLSTINSLESNNVKNTSFTYDTLKRITKETFTNSIIDHQNVSFVVENNFTYRDKNLVDVNTIKETKSRVNWQYNLTNYSIEVIKNIQKDIFERPYTDEISIGDYKNTKKYSYDSSADGKTCSLIKKITYENSYQGSNITSLGAFTYTYDNMGNIIKVEDTITGNVIDYKYDLLGRLVREDNQKLNKSKTWTYANNGNIQNEYSSSYTTGSLQNPNTIQYWYLSDYPDRLTEYNGKKITYDAAGNITSYDGKTFGWLYNRLSSISNSTVNMRFIYDGFGRRTEKSGGGSTVQYIYSQNKLIGERRITSSGTFELYYLYSGDEIIGFTYKNKSYYYLKNAQGDIIRLYNSANSVVATYVYDAWGNHKVYNSSGVENTSSTWVGNINPIRYRGYYYDVETGLFWCNSRYYNPEWGRWISPDSIEYLDPQSINGLNLYAYCNNNPVMYSDPDGHLPKWAQWVLGGAIVVAGVGLSILTAGLAAPIASAVGGGLLGAVVGGAVAGAVGGAIAGAGVSIGTQAILNGFDEINWSEVGKSTLSGAISGAITGGVFGGIRHVYSVERVASSVSGLNSAQTQMTQALSYSSGLGRLSNAQFIEYVVKYNAAYANNVIAQGTNFFATYGVKALYGVTQFGVKQLIGLGLNQIW